MPQQSTISYFFKPTQSPVIPKRRASSPIDLTGNDDAEIPKATKARPLKKSRHSIDASSPSKATAPASRSVEGKPRVYVSGDPSPPIIVTKPNGQAEASRPTVDPQRKWALDETGTSNSDTDILDEEEEKARKARRRAFAAKLTIRTSVRDRRQRDLEQAGSGSAAPVQGGDEEEPPGDFEVDDDTMDVDSDDQDGSRRKLSSTKSKGKAAVLPKAPKGKGKSKVEIGPSGQPYTPLEKQILSLKESHPGVILLIEVGYKYRFFGDDARVASKELGIACFPQRNFLSASIPVHRRAVHVKKLLSQGHKVGIIGQAETAALKKVSENKSGPFERKLTHLYTAATFVDGLDSVDDDGYTPPSASNALVCLVEKLLGGMGADEKVTIGLVSIVPSTGDVVYDEFQDSHMRTELETRMTHIRPCELLLPAKKLSNATKKMLTHFTNTSTGTSTSTEGTRTRIEEFQNLLDYSEAFDFLTEFYSTESKKGVPDVSEAFISGKLMATIVGLPKTVVVALAHTIKYLTEFELSDVFVQTSMFTKFATRAHMLLNGNTLSNLEIYRNQTDFTEKGSLLWILDRTKTRFGARLLKTWIGRPLVDHDILQERLDAVEEIINTQSHTLDRLRTLIRKLPDLVKGLCRIQYGKCTPKELAILLEAYTTVAKTFDAYDSSEDVDFKSPLLRSIVFALPGIASAVGELVAAISLYKAKADEKSELWVDEDKYPEIESTKLSILSVESELEEELKSIRKILKRPTLKWVHVNHDEFTVEVARNSVKDVPASWIRKSSTKAVVRFHTPEVKKLLAEREQLKETLSVECDKAFANFLVEVSGHYAAFRDCTNKIAIFDCLNSLALVASEHGYVKPEFVDEDVLDISRGRHPMVEALRSDPFVPNNISLGGIHPRHKIITGPNMGGKSSCVRMTALITIMAQIGSYVPAQKARLGLHDAVLTRMGASDELARGRSTFMVEISETCDIIKTASPRTLVILDELGRGTSTFDGMSIAFAVLQYLVETINCKTLFITHYPLLASEMGKLPEVNNGHMGFVEETRADGSHSINFLYCLSPGMARGSFGIECAQLAGMPEPILISARTRSIAMEEAVDSRRLSNKSRKALNLIRDCVENSVNTDPATSVEVLRRLVQQMD